MTLAWKSDFSTGQKMVLLALCDNANDQGECYPSITMLAEKCSISRTSIFEHLDVLEKSGAVTKHSRSGRSTIYKIDPSRFCTSTKSEPVRNLNPSRPKSGLPPVQILNPTRPDSVPITINEPSIEPSSNQNTTVKVFDLNDVPAEIVEDFSKLRKAKKSPLTKTAIDDIRREAGKAGLSMAEVLTMCCARGWVGFRAEWLVGRQGVVAAKTGASEPAWRREQRERTEKAVPGIAAKNPRDFENNGLQTFDVEVKNVTAIALGR